MGRPTWGCRIGTTTASTGKRSEPGKLGMSGGRQTPSGAEQRASLDGLCALLDAWLHMASWRYSATLVGCSGICRCSSGRCQHPPPAPPTRRGETAVFSKEEGQGSAVDRAATLCLAKTKGINLRLVDALGSDGATPPRSAGHGCTPWGHRACERFTSSRRAMAANTFRSSSAHLRRSNCSR